MDKGVTFKIEQLILEIATSEKYCEVSYLVSSIRKYFLQYLTLFRTKSFPIPAFVSDLVEYVDMRFADSRIAPTHMLEYMCDNDTGNWVSYYDCCFLRPSDKQTGNGYFECDSKFFSLILTGFILDKFRSNDIDIETIVKEEKFEYRTNQYNLTIVNDIEFKRDYFIFDNKAYLYSLLTKTSVIDFTDNMPGFAKIITEEANNGDILMRLDERLAVPKENAISYSTLNAEKFHGPQFHFGDSHFKEKKSVIVHIDMESADKLLMVIKQDFDAIRNEEIMHVEIETLPFIQGCLSDQPCITTFIHGIYNPASDCFYHIDYARNQYVFKDYDLKYREASTAVPVDFYAEKHLHNKIWCVENGSYSRETWYKLVSVSLSKKYCALLDEILA